MKGKHCGVPTSQENDTLCMVNICNTWKKDVLREKLNEYGIENLEEIT